MNGDLEKMCVTCLLTMIQPDRAGSDTRQERYLAIIQPNYSATLSACTCISISRASNLAHRALIRSIQHDRTLQLSTHEELCVH
jgi:hypothetical protein